MIENGSQSIFMFVPLYVIFHSLISHLMLFSTELYPVFFLLSSSKHTFQGHPIARTGRTTVKLYHMYSFQRRHSRGWGAVPPPPPPPPLFQVQTCPKDVSTYDV